MRESDSEEAIRREISKRSGQEVKFQEEASVDLAIISNVLGNMIIDTDLASSFKQDGIHRHEKDTELTSGYALLSFVLTEVKRFFSPVLMVSVIASVSVGLFHRGFFVPKSFSRGMKAVGIVEIGCEEIFELVMSIDEKQFE
ncbi:hypothetical protein L1987_08568 [Smallanthus sonchifolius]|uniref:Uncharacterized protein n=1 Tax=Smallanthus sonchifolius TaxID=185202 RepID=A0ACB9JLJ6_9ASTR|nr:hypothetical protein L1987_08568 [Smallanthus sonchifolius]